jgi:Leucine-rich repeat (LRR) protein
MKRRSFFRFSLRAFLIALTSVCVVLGVLTSQSRRKEYAIQWVIKHGGRYDDFDMERGEPVQRHTVPTYLWWLLGEHYFVRVNSVRIHTSDIDDLSPLASFPELESLVLVSSNVSDLRPLSGLTRLKALNLANNKIADLTPLTSLTSLKHLDVNTNRVSDLTPLSSLAELETLDVSQNSIVDIAPVKGLSTLWSADFMSNQIHDCTPLYHLSNLVEIDLSGNPIPDNQLKKLRPSLPSLARLNGEAVRQYEQAVD